MLKLFKNCFNITNGCLIVAVPLIVFLSIFGWYYTFAAAYINDVSKFIFAAITAVVLVCGCMSGWFYMLKKAMYMSTKIFLNNGQPLSRKARICPFDQRVRCLNAIRRLVGCSS